MDIGITLHEKVINGIRTCYIKTPFALSLHARFMTLAGSFAENEQNQGIAHYLEHLFFKGTDNRTMYDISDDAALLGASQNAYTSQHQVCYYLTGPAVNLDGIVGLLCDMMFNPTFPQEEIDKERTVIQEERKSYEDDHGSFFFQEVHNHMFTFDVGHWIIGTEDTINGLNRDDFVSYRKDMYGLNNTVFLVVGALPEDEVFDVCAKHFEGNTLTQSVDVPECPPFLNKVPDLVVPRKGIQQTFMLGVFDGSSMSDNAPEYPCMIKAIGGGMFSLLFKRIREELGLCYHISSSSYQKSPEQSVYYIYTQLSPDQKDLARREIIKCLDDVRKNGFDQKQFDCAKAAILGSYARCADSIESLAETASNQILWDLPFDIGKRYNEMINLTLDDVNAYSVENVPSEEDIQWATMNPDEEDNGASDEG
jgi:predicted Zn-dependent peptidase